MTQVSFDQGKRESVLGSELVREHRLCFVYASARTYQQAYSILEDCYATGDVSEHEYHDIIKFRGRWCLILAAE